MKQLSDRFILGLPVLFLKQYPYAWIAVVAVWPRTRSVAAVFLSFQETGKFFVKQSPYGFGNAN